MVYTHTPTYYTSLHDSILSLCKSILPFKKKRLPSGDQSLGKLQSDNLKWQQDSFHQMLNLMGLQREGILADHEVSSFRVYILQTLIASPLNIEHPCILRDKLLFLQELLNAKCISQDEYHASKRPLLQRLAVRGAEIQARDVIGGGSASKESYGEEWSVIYLKEENWLLKESSNSKSKHSSTSKQVKGVGSVFGYASPNKPGKDREEKSICSSAMREVYGSTENPFWNVHLKKTESDTKRLHSVSDQETGSTERVRRKPFRTLFRKTFQPNTEGKVPKSEKKQFKNTKRNYSEDETAPLPHNDGLYSEEYLPVRQLDFSPDVKVTETKQKLHLDGSCNNELKKEHVGEMDKSSTSTQWTTFNEGHQNGQLHTSTQWTTFNEGHQNGQLHTSTQWTTFNEGHKNGQLDTSTQWTIFDDEDENCHPNLFASQNKFFKPKQQSIEGAAFKNRQTNNINNYCQTNPFLIA